MSASTAPNSFAAFTAVLAATTLASSSKVNVAGFSIAFILSIAFLIASAFSSSTTSGSS